MPKGICTLQHSLPVTIEKGEEHQRINQRQMELKPEGLKWPMGQRELKSGRNIYQSEKMQYILLRHLPENTLQLSFRFQITSLVCNVGGEVCK